MSEWISVKDRLPDDHVAVLVYRENNIDVECEKFSTDAYWGGAWDYNSDISHWMPLPPPPKTNPS